jgi:hypothetical protein
MQKIAFLPVLPFLAEVFGVGDFSDPPPADSVASKACNIVIGFVVRSIATSKQYRASQPAVAQWVNRWLTRAALYPCLEKIAQDVNLFRRWSFDRMGLRL